MDGKENIRLAYFVCEGCGARLQVIFIADATDEQLAGVQIVCPCQKVYRQ